ncbi:MAG: nucleotidyltransferase domain-containing protein [Planctomycetes bacterium]|nr:nucleotidyltransferase domain-containing protein [Planctomycetota bacterium]
MVQTPAESEAVLQQVVECIATRFHPDKIILFGSRARGQSGPNSDADLLVIMPTNGSKRQQAVQIDLALEGIPIPIDLIVVAPEEVEKYRDATGTIIGEAVREGKVLYERAA